MTEPDQERTAPPRTEIWWMVLCTIVAGIVRFVYLGQEGISHFDEGVYVLWGAGVGYPMPEFFAPPIYPALLRAAFVILGPSDIAAKGVSAVIGTATVPLMWWVARRWFGPIAAAACPPLVAFSGIHIVFSRMALTDVAFLFGFLLGLLLISEVLVRCVRPETTAEFEHHPVGVRRVWLWAIAAGLAAGAAWNTKYNGFLTLAIAVGAVCVCAAWPPWRTQIAWPTLLCATTALVAVAVLAYSPWYLHVERTHSYARLLEHHRGYSSGLASWASNLWTLFLEHRGLNGSLGWIGLALSVLASAVARGRAIDVFGLRRVGLASLVGVAAGDAALWLFGPLLLAITARGWPVHAVFRVWLIALFFLTPFYKPYPRLLLPLAAAGWIVFAAMLATSFGRERSTVHSEPAVRMWPAIIAACLAIVAILPHARSLRSGADEAAGDRPTLQAACEMVAESLPAEVPTLCFVRPPVLFYVAAQRPVRLMNPDSDIDELIDGVPSGRANLLIDRALVRDTPQLGQRLAAAGARLRQRASVAYWPGLRVALDDFGPDALRPESLPQMHATYELIVIAIEPASE